jgi:hypothetical protein
MAKLNCPVPGCPEATFRRQTDVNTHLCDDHQIDLKRQYGGNMKALRVTQQAQFSSWLEANGHPNLSLFANVPNEQPANHERHNDSLETVQEALEVNAHNDTTSYREGNEASPQVDMSDGIEDLLRMIETTDESGLDVRRSHANDTHAIVCEDGALWYADQRPMEEDYDE